MCVFGPMPFFAVRRACRVQLDDGRAGRVIRLAELTVEALTRGNAEAFVAAEATHSSSSWEGIKSAR
jgi:hypothetical protein